VDRDEKAAGKGALKQTQGSERWSGGGRSCKAAGFPLRGAGEKRGGIPRPVLGVSFSPALLCCDLLSPYDTDSGLECPVCKDDYTVGENVRQLPCNHLFHNSCIVPWLEQVSASGAGDLGSVALGGAFWWCCSPLPVFP